MTGITFDAALLRNVTLPGVFPAKQKRSQDLVHRLLGVALELLQERDFDALSVADLCAAAGVSVGPFYGRFESKDAFFRYLQHLIVEDTFAKTAADLLRPELREGGLRPFLRRVVGGGLLWYRKYEGLIRTSLRRAQVDPEAWAPIRDLGARQSAVMLDVILDIVGHRDDPAVLETIGFAVQSMMGTLNNMTLVNPRPFSIHHPRTEPLLVEALALQIEAAVTRSAARPSARRAG